MKFAGQFPDIMRRKGKKATKEDGFRKTGLVCQVKDVPFVLETKKVGGACAYSLIGRC